MKNYFLNLLRVLAAVLALASARAGAQIIEPDTVFYGQIINRTTAQIDLVSSGKLAWTIARPDGQPITVRTVLAPLGNGRYSYRLSVPHEALTYGLTVDSSQVPLSASAAMCTITSILVDTNLASIVAPGASTFTVGQGLRASTYRLDLELTNQLASTSGDGIPDWWKALYGVSDPNGITSADGLSNLKKYQMGGTPNQDNRFPTLLTTEYWAYADGSTELPLTVVDSDSASTNIVFTLNSLPGNGGFYLRNYTNDVPLSLGSQFTLDDVNSGRLVFTHNGPAAYAGPVSFSVGLCDENPAHATNYVVWLNVYRPNYPDNVNQAAQAAANAPFGFSDIPGLAFGEQQMLINYFLSRDHGYIIADDSRFALSRTNQAAVVTIDRELPHVLVGGTGNDRLVGGAGNDIFVGGRGNDVMRGNGGSDLFIISGPNSGNDIIEDFSTNNADALDLSRVLLGAAWQLTNYVQLTTDNTNTYLGINYQGTGGFTNMTITLLGVQYSQTNLRALCDGGYLLTGVKALSPSVTITATQPAASENGPTPGQFTVTRSGSLLAALPVNLTISGSAINGTSYQLIANQVTIPAGQRTATIAVNPYLTADTLPTVVQMALAAGTGYDIGAANSAQVSIAPLSAQVSIQAVAGIAEKASATPAIFSVTRGGIFNSAISVRLGLGGTASSNLDYTLTDDSGHTISPTFPLLSFAANQTEAFIYVTPKATASLTAGPKSVTITLKTNATYVVMNPSFDRVFLVNQLLTGAAWQQQYFPGASADWNTFANADTGNKGIKNLYRYAFGLNATNPVATNGLPYYRIINGHLCVTFRHPLSVTDYNYVTQVSDDLVNWSSLSNDVQAFTPPDVSTNDVELNSYRSTAAVGSGKPKQFMRVVVQPTQ
jgi:hypothetical protein